MDFGLPRWAWKLILMHLSAKHSRSAVRWMNRFAFFGIVVGVFALTAIVSIMTGLQNEIKENVIAEKPHLLWEGSPRKGLEEKREALTEYLGEELKDLRFVLQSEGLLEQIKSSQKGRISGSGVVFQGVENLGEGIEVGEELAKLLRLEMGSKVLLHSVWQMDLPPHEATVSGYFKSGLYQVDKSTLRLDRKILEGWLDLKGAVSRIEIRLAHPEKAEEFSQKINEILSLPVKTWKQTESSLWYSLRLEKIVMTLTVFFVVFLASLSVHLALSLRVAEKTREIALLLAIGVEDKILSRLFIYEGAAIGFMGSVCGVLISYFFCKFISGYYKLPEIYYLTNFPTDWNWGRSIGMALLAVFLSVMASLLPAKKVECVEIAEALRS